VKDLKPQRRLDAEVVLVLILCLHVGSSCALLIGRASRRDEHQMFSPVQAVSARPRPEATAVLRGTRSATNPLVGDRWRGRLCRWGEVSELLRDRAVSANSARSKCFWV